MDATPLWVPLAVAVLGLLGTLGGVIYSQHRAERIEKERWDREREREVARWEREDRARSYEHRREAYIKFIRDWQQMYDELFLELIHSSGPLGAPEGHFDSLYRQLVEVQVFGTRDGARLATAAFDALLKWDFEGRRSNFDYSVFEVFRDRARLDLGVPDAGPSEG